MANWSPLRARLADVDEQVTIAWGDLDDLVGGLPRSAYNHVAFWKGDRTGWPGFTTIDVHVGRSVTFVRRQPRGTSTAVPRPSTPSMNASSPDVVLVGCVRKKLPHPAPAKDLYDSPLFAKERTYAEATDAPWFILSAEHGLVDPSSVIEPYDLRLSKTPRAYRRAWGNRVVELLVQAFGPLAGRVIEVHAGSAYVDAIRDLLAAQGAEVREPLQGLSMGRRLAWYGKDEADSDPPTPPPPAPEVDELVTLLGTDRSALTPAEFLATGGAGLRHPGLYSWWVDEAGAVDLSDGLGEPVEPGLIYAGLAGATRRRSGRKSTNTLWGRIEGMHLGGRHEFSTFRLSLGSVIANARGDAEIDEGALTAWMHDHLRLRTVVVEDADALDALETEVLAKLDPPLNLNEMRLSTARTRLSALRRRFNQKKRGNRGDA
ncbi:DUF6884 domain-containing protein [Nocardioides sp.]|uniref:DUF6884 domain-containing protein n=1 Tax=Nocardioides sp. TaxID=35761 RepID=UPI003BEECE99